MDYQKLAALLFPTIHATLDEYETIFPPRSLPCDAKVTRLAPSPTGYIHLGNLYGAFVDERLAHQSNGTFILRIEDTDEKRKVAGAEETIINSLAYYGLCFDEGVTKNSEVGSYGPYYQSNRKKIYQSAAKYLVSIGRAYPCFRTEEELTEIRSEQSAAGVNLGYYGKWAKDRNLTLETIQSNLENGKPYVIRFRSHGDLERSFSIQDGIRGILTMPENDQDTIILKSNGIPTYHFAHVVDDHFMRTTHVVRGEEWLSTLPIHYELFQTFGWVLPIYCHTAHLMKIDNGVKRKLSKRKDPELGLEYYMQLGYHPMAVKEYLLTILNSDFEEWRIANPNLPMTDFPFTLEKMGISGSLFDLDKLNDVSKRVLVRIPATDIYDFLLKWATKYRTDAAELLKSSKNAVIRLLDVGRDGKNPRKDLIYAQQIFDFISYYFDDYFQIEDKYPSNVSEDDTKIILKDYLKTYNHTDDQSEWFEKIRDISSKNGYAPAPKQYKKNPDAFKGHVGDVSTVIRIAVMGRSNSPDVWSLQQIMGEEKVRQRIQHAIEH